MIVDLVWLTYHLVSLHMCFIVDAIECALFIAPHTEINRL